MGLCFFSVSALITDRFVFSRIAQEVIEEFYDIFMEIIGSLDERQKIYKVISRGVFKGPFAPSPLWG